MDQKQGHAEIVNRILSGARWAATLRLIAQTISWLSAIVVVRFISPGDYGLNAMLEAPLEILFLLSTLGLDAALVRSKHIEQYQLRSAFGWLLIINVLLFLGYFFGGALIAAYFNEPRLDQLAKTLAFIFLLVPFRVIPNALLDRDLKFKLKAFVDLTSSISTAVVTLVLAIMGAGIWALIIGILVNRVLSAIMLMILQPWFVTPSFSFSALREMMAFGGIMTLGSALVLISDKLISLIAGPIMGAELLGVYAVALQFALLPLAKIMPVINPIIFPAFSKFQEQRGAAAHYLGRSLGVVSLGLFPIMIGTACIAQEFVSTILGEKWLAVTVPLALLSVVMPFRVTTSFIRPVLSSMGRPDLALKSTFVTLCILLPLILTGINYGLTGLVVAVMVTEIIVTLVTIRMSKSVLDTSFYKIALSLRPAVISTAIMAVCVLGVKVVFGYQVGFGGLLIEIGVGVISYYLALRIFYRKWLEDAINLFLGRR